MYSKYTGIILKKFPLNEADELLTIYTREVGKLRVKAQATRKIKSRLAGNLQTLNEIDFEVARRSPSAAGGLPVLISVRPHTINAYLRQDLKKFAQALVGVETLYRITPDEEQNLEIYVALCEFLKNLGQTPEENAEVRRFQLRVLAAAGYEFPLLSSLRGFVRPSAEGRRDGRRSNPTEIAAHPSGARNDREWEFRLTPEFERALDQFLQEILEREIKSKKFLNSVT